MVKHVSCSLSIPLRELKRELGRAVAPATKKQDFVLEVLFRLLFCAQGLFKILAFPARATAVPRRGCAASCLEVLFFFGRKSYGAEGGKEPQAARQASNAGNSKPSSARCWATRAFAAS